MTRPMWHVGASIITIGPLSRVVATVCIAVHPVVIYEFDGGPAFEFSVIKIFFVADIGESRRPSSRSSVKAIQYFFNSA